MSPRTKKSEATPSDVAERPAAEQAADGAVTLVVPPDHGPPQAAEPEISPAQKRAALDALELRVSELASYVRADAALHQVEPKALGKMLADRLAELL